MTAERTSGADLERVLAAERLRNSRQVPRVRVVLVSEAMRPRVDTGIGFAPVGPVAVKGKTEPVQTYVPDAKRET